MTSFCNRSWCRWLLIGVVVLPCGLGCGRKEPGASKVSPERDTSGPPDALLNTPRDQEAKREEVEPSRNAPHDKVVPEASGRVMAIVDKTHNTHALADLLPQLGPRVVESDDPYYQRLKRFWSVPALPFLKVLFPEEDAEFRSADFVVKAKDGYEVHVSGEKLSEGFAYFAFADAEHESFQPIGEQKASPAPLYLIWEGERSDLKIYPRPWAIASIEKREQGAGLERTVPPEGFGDDAKAERGDEIFKHECIRCHAINQQGGKVGPDLNVPQNILTYRPEAQVRSYIKDPKTFRYSSMPPHPDLTDEDLDALIRYLAVMGKHQIDPHVDVTPETAHDHD